MRSINVSSESVLFLKGRRVIRGGPEAQLKWVKPHFFLRYLRDPVCVDLFCLGVENAIPDLQDNIRWLNPFSILSDPYILFNSILRAWHHKLGKTIFEYLRDQVFELEISQTISEDYQGLHELARNITQQTNEVIPNVLGILAEIQQDYQEIIEDVRNNSSDYKYPERHLPITPMIYEFEPRRDYKNTLRDMRGLVLSLRVIQNGYVTLEKRLDNQINLVRIKLRNFILSRQKIASSHLRTPRAN